MITVLVVEDNNIIRDSLRALLNGTEGLSCPGAYNSCEQLFANNNAISNADIVLMDIGLPGMDGIEGVKKLKQMRPELDIVMLTVYEENQKVFDALCAGACGYLVKKTPPVKLLEAISEVYNGGSPMSPVIARKVVGILQGEKKSTASENDDKLTEREIEVLSCLSDGQSYQEIADRLYISIDTVRQHIKSIYGKLHVHTQSGAVAKAIRKGII